MFAKGKIFEKINDLKVNKFNQSKSNILLILIFLPKQNVFMASIT